mmetsp:Transcript_62433/g.101101  ORF Transcript_62433/g.101101 Transcript_62433/m.101101 type:complete len:202 (-) Transcript_62433:7-612(-)
MLWAAELRALWACHRASAFHSFGVIRVVNVRRLGQPQNRSFCWAVHRQVVLAARCTLQARRLESTIWAHLLLLLRVLAGDAHRHRKARLRDHVPLKRPDLMAVRLGLLGEIHDAEDQNANAEEGKQQHHHQAHGELHEELHLVLASLVEISSPGQLQGRDDVGSSLGGSNLQIHHGNGISLWRGRHGNCGLLRSRTVERES